MMTLLPTPWELELVDRKFLASHNQIHQPTCFHIRIYCVHGWSFCFYLFALSTCSLDLFPLTVSRSHFCFAAVPISLSSLACCHCHCYTHGKPPPCNPTSPSSYCSIYLLVFTVTNWKYFLGYGLHSVFFFFFTFSPTAHYNWVSILFSCLCQNHLHVVQTNDLQSVFMLLDLWAGFGTTNHFLFSWNTFSIWLLCYHALYWFSSDHKIFLHLKSFSAGPLNFGVLWGSVLDSPTLPHLHAPPGWIL